MSSREQPSEDEREMVMRPGVGTFLVLLPVWLVQEARKAWRNRK